MTTNGLLIIIVMILWSWDIDRRAASRGPNDLSPSAEKLLTVAFIGSCYAFGWL
jgi:hypothetical protein